MSAFIYFPPVEIISPNSEFVAQKRNDASQFQQTTINSLTTKLSSTIPSSIGRFKVFSWTGSNDLFIISKIFLSPLKEAKVIELIRVNVVIKKNDCTFVGASWEYTKESEKIWESGSKTPTSNFSSPQLTDIISRETDDVTTFGLGPLYSSTTNLWSDDLIEVMVGERFAENKIPVTLASTRSYCLNKNPNLAKIEKKKNTQDLTPNRPHYLITFQLKPEKSSFHWPNLQGKVLLNSGVFGKREETLATVPPSPFHPNELAKNILTNLKPWIDDLKKNKFYVFKRYYRWIYLKQAGKAHGLSIGMHLLGPRGEKMHVIHFDPKESSSSQPDAAVALLRQEDRSNPLKVGDEISIDPTLYPKYP